VFLSSTSSKAAVITIFIWKWERRNCDSLGHKVSNPLICNAPGSGFIRMFHTQHATSWRVESPELRHSAYFVGACPYNIVSTQKS